LYTDERLTCTDCGAEFVFTAGEQEFFATKGFQNKPNRCADCRAVRKASRGQGGGGAGGGGGARSHGAREMYSVTCSKLWATGRSAVPTPRRQAGLLQRLLRAAFPLTVPSM